MKPLKVVLIVLAVAAVLAAAVWFFYPRPRVIGGLRGGPIAPGESAYREDFACIGIPYDFCPPWPDYGCDYWCLGLVTHRTCTMETYEMQAGLTRDPVPCR